MNFQPRGEKRKAAESRSASKLTRSVYGADQGGQDLAVYQYPTTQRIKTTIIYCLGSVRQLDGSANLGWALLGASATHCRSVGCLGLCSTLCSSWAQGEGVAVP